MGHGKEVNQLAEYEIEAITEEQLRLMTPQITDHPTLVVYDAREGFRVFGPPNPDPTAEDRGEAIGWMAEVLRTAGSVNQSNDGARLGKANLNNLVRYRAVVEDLQSTGDGTDIKIVRDVALARIDEEIQKLQADNEPISV